MTPWGSGGSVKSCEACLGFRLCMELTLLLFQSLALTSLRIAFCSAASSSKMPLANTGAVLSVLGPEGCDPAFHVVWARLRMTRRHLCFFFWHEEIRMVYWMLDRVAGREGHGPVHLLTDGARVIGLTWDMGLQAWLPLGLPDLYILAALFNMSKLLFKMFGDPRFPKILAKMEGVSRWPFVGDLCISTTPCLIPRSCARQRIAQMHPCWNSV